MIKRLILSLVLSFAFLSVGYCAEITTQELDLLETNLNQLEINNKKSQVKLKTLEINLETLKEQLTISNQKSKSQEQLLRSANESFVKYEQEMKEENKRLKRQRNLAYTFLVFAFLGGFNK